MFSGTEKSLAFNIAEFNCIAKIGYLSEMTHDNFKNVYVIICNYMQFIVIYDSGDLESGGMWKS